MRWESTRMDRDQAGSDQNFDFPEIEQFINYKIPCIFRFFYYAVKPE